MNDKLLSGRRVLIVEDEVLIQLMIEDMLTDLGCESVSAAGTIDQAVALIDAQVFDAAILDVNLNNRSSHVVADALAARGVPFVFCTGSSVFDMKGGHRDRAVLRKPFGEKELAEALGRLLPL